MIVLKFGGTSVATAKRIQGVGDIISSLKKKHPRICVVFSAFGGVTDDLIRMSHLASARDQEYIDVFHKIRERHNQAILELDLRKDKNLHDFMEETFAELHDILHGVFLVRELSARTLDFISGHGELLSARIISHYFNSVNIKSGFLDARKVIETDENFGNARVDFAATNKKIAQHFKKASPVEVITGFIASTSLKEMTTLGRGGSDYTASIFGAALNAKEIQIWTDVDGVMTADPRKVKKAFSVPQMTYEEAMEMSHFGAKVIHPPTIQPALEKEIPLRIKNSFKPEAPGTIISTRSSGRDYLIKGISSIDDVSLLTLQGSGMVGVSGTSARLFNAIAMSGVNVILITQGSSEHSISFAVKPGDSKLAARAIENAFALEINAGMIDRVRVEEKLSIVAVIGENMRNTPGASGRLFQSFGKNGISAVATAQGSSELNISVVIHKENLGKALNTLHQAFFLSDVKTLSLFIVGTGLIGNTLLKQIESHKKYLRSARALEICIAGISNSRKMYFNPDGISTGNYMDLLGKEGEQMDIDKFISKMNELNLPQSIFVDCTSNEEIVRKYADVLSHSISIVTPNKIANSGKMENYKKLRDIARSKNVRFLYETNVGAGLPVINTLTDLLTSGDKIIRIEAVLSGTLSFIFNNFKKGVKFSDIVKEAKAKGYTEPDPRDDLSGMDVARKLLILARETGLDLELTDVSVEKILPRPCLKATTVEKFLEELEKNNSVFEKMRKEAESQKKVLRFIARLENGKASVRLMKVDSSHPFYNLSGSDNIISYTTERYSDRPLVVKGPGAGAEVTAAGVFAEIISIGKYFE
ncbi:MAG: bifunctional aspartate kinase/homoserine dehydrogenase I [Bacteroidetes bacterium]|nr:MAG: bifunctional aspartate kinase/homoserine dehydrogenase I [Bacteroidota bacterium]REK08142.1 MAG: bifunctional aspartate kinase/homoserine dehydrogenase I [Bacteroidota bacterium]REK32347.1 MAG: bifunctional aspartate kinase/homoserine dehydrogenase I [Bacteroidota bacterium]REK49581.1 MAG: bifunctional aspartate kinase/homoserine dehydrogenase I [Bacteroidota bacterium]